jgi:hypothetical protein
MERFNITNGGNVVQYELGRILKNFGQNVKMYTSSGINEENEIFNDFYNNDFPIDENAFVIYCEGTEGNPLNAKNVVRWILSELGHNVKHDIIYTWGEKDLVYYFNSEIKFEKNPERIGKVYKLLNCIYINPIIAKTNFGERFGTCYTIRKGRRIHKENFYLEHPEDSFEIIGDHSLEECVEFFNRFKFFKCYDPLSFYIIIAALCGCVPIIHKIQGLSKNDWIKTTSAHEYVKDKSLDNLYGIAYGEEDLQYAIDTLHLVGEQWNDIHHYCKEKIILPFISDLIYLKNNNNIDNKMDNCVKSNYFSELCKLDEVGNVIETYHFEASESLSKNNPFYIYTSDAGCQDFRYTKTYDELYKINKQFEDRPPLSQRDDRLKIIIYARPLDFNCGGIVAMHNLAKQINDLKNPNVCAKIFIFNGVRYRNIFCEDFARIEEAAEENSIVVYPEVIRGNPLNCKKVVRWILLSLDTEMKLILSILNNGMTLKEFLEWGDEDLVYHFNSDEKLEKNPETFNITYKMLTTLYLNDNMKQTNFEEKYGVCYSIRKSNVIHGVLGKDFTFIHPSNSFEIIREHCLQECMSFFNKYKWCVFYDTLTFYIIYAAICGCVPVVLKKKGLTKSQWIETTAAAKYLKHIGFDNLYGIAYGQEDMTFALETIHLAKQQWLDILNYCKESMIVPFVNDVQNFENVQNKVKHIF